MLHFFYILFDTFDGLVYPDQITPERQGIVEQVVPSLSGMIAVIVAAAFVFFRHGFRRMFRGELIYLNRSLDAKIQIGADKYIHHMVHIPQNIIRASAYDDTWPLVCYLPDHIGLCKKDPVVQRQTRKSYVLICEYIHPHGNGIQKTVGCFILHCPESRFGKSGLLRRS